MFKKVNPKQNFPELEEEVLKFWDKKKTFERSVEDRPADKTFSFYDGPPFATGLPHYGHLLAGFIKDVIPRYKTMQGYKVERVWGWDTHGLPIENIVEQELDFKSKTQIKEYGIDKFNEKCRTKVLEYAEEWEKIVARTGRWVDMKNAYLTMDQEYMESVWWVFKNLWDKKLVYKGHKVMPYCPRCATGLSSFEVGLGGYQDKTDKAITLKFELEDEPNTYILAWTTTPWTLPGNLALAVGKDINYVTVVAGKAKYILAEDRLQTYKELIGAKVQSKIKGKELLGKKYKPLFNYYNNDTSRQARGKKAFEIIAGDFVSTEDGTGVVHIAPAFGEDDYNVARENDIDFFMPVNDLGEFQVEVPEYAGKNVIHAETNEQIIKDLGGKVLKEEDFSHQYPFCWRCDTPLIYKAIDSWFVRVADLKEKMLAENKKVYWMPDFVGKGRFAKMIEDAPDWNISRQRFWGVPLPVWTCEKCGERKVFGSVAELEKATGKQINDIHLHKMVGLKLSCKCGGEMKIVGEVLDVWFDSGSMPYGSIHYPFKNQDKFEKDFPADFIAEGIDQTRGWFNSLLVLGTALFGKSPYKNVVVNGTVLAEDGQKMSKRLKNYPDPSVVMDKHGADAMRFYLMMSPAVRAEDLRFSEKGVDEIVKKVVLTLWNSYSFFVTYASLDNFTPNGKLNPKNVLDKWVISKTNELTKNITDSMEAYDLSTSCRYLLEFMDELSNWYIRRSRKRFWKSENDGDKNAAYETLYFVLTTYIKLLAPFMPFVTEEIYRNLVAVDKKAPASVHLADWPKYDEKAIDGGIENEMDIVRRIVEIGLALRNESGIKVRQPLASINVATVTGKLHRDLEKIILEEVNVKNLQLTKGSGLKGSGIIVKGLDIKITPELKSEGIARDMIRYLQDTRKKAGFNVEDRINTKWEASDQRVAGAMKKFSDYIAKETLSMEFSEGKTESTYSETIKLDGKEVWFGITRQNR